MTTEREALKQALATLEEGNFVYPTALRTAIIEALSQPSDSVEQELAEFVAEPRTEEDIKTFGFMGKEPEEQFCYCDDSISLQIVSGGAAVGGLYSRVTLKIDGEYIDYVRKHPKPECDWEGITADQAMTIALMKSEQPEQEPNGYVQTVIEALYENGDPVSVDAAELLQRITAQPEQESTADMMMGLADRLGELPDDVDPRAWEHLLVYAPKREWVGLTPADYDAMRPRVPYIVNDFLFCDVAAIIEAKLKELNHG